MQYLFRNIAVKYFYVHVSALNILTWRPSYSILASGESVFDSWRAVSSHLHFPLSVSLRIFFLAFLSPAEVLLPHPPTPASLICQMPGAEQFIL